MDKKYWKGVLDVLDETFEATRIGMKVVTDSALIEMRNKLKSRNLQTTPSPPSFPNSDKKEDGKEETIRPAARRKTDS